MGAWSSGYYAQGMGTAQGTDHVSLAILAIERELVSNGFNVSKINGHFGAGTSLAVKNFQLRKALLSDGVVGPKTSKALFLPRVMQLEGKYDIPDHLLEGIAAHESSWDPGAVGSTVPADKGLVQINLETPPTVRFTHPEITLELAFDAAFALDYCAHTLAERRANFATKCPEIAMDCAVVSWNSPRNAADWCSTGEPNDAALHYIQEVRGAADA